MMCKKPFMRKVSGHKKGQLLHEEGRLAATPFPCGQCFHCRINRAREWTLRIMLEASTHDDSCFVTLTYNDDFLPRDCSLDKEELKRYLKRVRKKIEPRKMRYLAVGEYGEYLYRPHFHLILFGVNQFEEEVIKGSWQWQSYPIGHVLIGDVNKNSARYVAGYCMKGLNNTDTPFVRKNHPNLVGRNPEYMTSSKKGGGIGLRCIENIVEEMKKQRWYTPRVIKEIKLGGQKMPLGRYLTMKMCKLQGIPEHIMYRETIKYQNEIMSKHILTNDDYYVNIVDENISKRLSKEKRYKIYRQKRRL